MDEDIACLAEKYLPLAVKILREIIRIPADFVDKPEPEGGDLQCGLSNHEFPRINYLKTAIIEYGAVERPEDVSFDEFGNLVWSVSDPSDGIQRDLKKVVYFDGHTDTVKALRCEWKKRVGDGLDAYDGMIDANKVDEAGLRRELGYLPPRDQWEFLVWGRGSADQLAGVVSQVIATKIMLELRPKGALKGVIVRSYGTIAEEDNDGGAPMYLCRDVLPGAPPSLIPDAVIFTEGTGDSQTSSLGIYRGQRGRMIIEVEVVGKSCHGSMPWEGRNPLEAGALIIAEAASKYQNGEGFLSDPVLGGGTRTASWCHLDTPSDCAVPEKFTFRFDRRLTQGETAEKAVKDIESMASVDEVRSRGFGVTVSVPKYSTPTWKGRIPGNDQIYNSWLTPRDHEVIYAAEQAYLRVVSPHVPKEGTSLIKKEPRVQRWIFSTDGVGFIVPAEKSGIDVPSSKKWIKCGPMMHPPMFGFGAGFEQNTHKIGECVDSRELKHAIALLARFPSLLNEVSSV